MRIDYRSTYITVILLLLVNMYGRVSAQHQDIYQPNETFRPIDYLSGDRYRTATGKPGGEYWQNQADYKIKASFDTLTRKLDVSAEITYNNNSPDVLNEIWIDFSIPNRFKKGSTAQLLTPLVPGRFDIKEFTNGVEIKEVKFRGKLIERYHIYNDYLKISIPEGLKAGTKVKFSVSYVFTVPIQGSDFMGSAATKYGSIYQIAFWTPKVMVHDNVQGWNFGWVGYGMEPGNMDYYVEVDDDLIVQGTGKLVNPKNVLSDIQYKRYQLAGVSDTTVRIRTAQEVSAEAKITNAGKKTWHFSSSNCGEANFSVSKAFIWDAISVNINGKAPAMAMSLYPVESNVKEWQESARDMKEILESYSQKWGPYPYSTAVLVGGGVSGLAGPGVSFINFKSRQGFNGLWAILNHEIGHTWFNFMIGTITKELWVSEGFCSFICDLNARDLKRTGGFEMKELVRTFSIPRSREPVSTHSFVMKPQYHSALAYRKPALALHLLRTKVLGEKRFDAIFRAYINTWSFKHPTTQDFYRFMENGSAENLSWFWRSWFLNDWTLDQSINSVVYAGKTPESGINIQVQNLGKMVMPLTVEVKDVNGNTTRIELPVDIWKRGSYWTFHHPSRFSIASVNIDPDYAYPDADRANNFFYLKTKTSDFPAPAGFGTKTN